MQHDTLGDAADEERFQAGFVARTHYDQIRPPLLGVVGDQSLGIAFLAGAIGVESPGLELGDGAGNGIRSNVIRRVLNIGNIASTCEQLNHRRVNVLGDRENAEFSPLRPGDGGRRRYRVGGPIVASTDCDQNSHIYFGV